MKFRLIQGDCFQILPKLIDGGVKVNMCFLDLPYNETGYKWDKKGLNYDLLFKYLKELITEDGAILFTGTFKHGVTLYNHCSELYKYEWVWEKDNGTNIPNVNYQPFRVHEYIFVYGKGRVSHGKRTPMKYHPQKTKGTPYTQFNSSNNREKWKGGLNRTQTINKGDRHPHTIQYWKRDRGYHPTQKPVAMIEYFIQTYTDEQDWVLDFTMGSGSTGVACKKLNRNFIGVELDKEYYEIARRRIQE